MLKFYLYSGSDEIYTYINIYIPKKKCPEELAEEFFWHVSQCLKFRTAVNSVEKALPSSQENSICLLGMLFMPETASTELPEN